MSPRRLPFAAADGNAVVSRSEQAQDTRYNGCFVLVAIGWRWIGIRHSNRRDARRRTGKSRPHATQIKLDRRPLLLRYSVNKRGRLFVAISAECVSDLTAKADASSPSETGGVLMGFWLSAWRAEITHAIAPSSNPVHSIGGSLLDDALRRSEIARVYHETKQRSTYLGQWQSHLTRWSHLSTSDMDALARMRTSADKRAPAPLIAIVDGGRPWSLSVWSGRVVKSQWLDRLELLRGRIEITETA